MPTITCAHCGASIQKDASAVNRANKAGLSVYCNRICAGLGRRKGKPPEQKKAEKAEYDRKRRADLADKIKATKAAYHKRTYDPVKAAEYRKQRMPYHVEYCRSPKYRAWKREYDQQYLARKQYGEFGEVAIALRELEEEVLERIDRIDVYATNGTLNKKQTRRRKYESSTGCTHRN